jgi:hypothetical protein
MDNWLIIPRDTLEEFAETGPVFMLTLESSLTLFTEHTVRLYFFYSSKGINNFLYLNYLLLGNRPASV